MTDATPIPDLDHLPLGDVRQRLRSLTEPELITLIAQERDRSARPGVLTAAHARLAELRGGAQPSGGAADGVNPTAPEQAATGSRVSPQTAGPKLNPPSQGTPQNPAQPR